MRRSDLWRLAALCLSALALAGCDRCSPREKSGGSAGPGGILKEQRLSGDQQLFTSEFGEVRVSEMREILSLFDPGKLRRMAYDRAGIERLVDYLIGQRVAIEEAKGADLGIEDEFLLAPELTYYNLLYEKFIESSKSEFVQSRMTPGLIDSYYAANPEAFTPKKPRKRIALIRLPLSPESVELGGRLIKEINAGSLAFEEAARLYSNDEATASRGGEYGWWDATLPGSEDKTAFDQVVAATEKDAPLAGLNFTPSGYYLVRVLETAPPRPLPLDRVSNLVRARIWADGIAAYYQERMSRLCESAGATLDLKPLEVHLPEELPSDPDLVLGHRTDGSTLTWGTVRAAFPTEPDNYNIGKWTVAAMNRVRALCLEPGLPPADVERARMASRWLAAFRRAGLLNRKLVEARYNEMPEGTEVLEQYYERNIERYQRKNAITGQLEAIPYGEIAGHVSAHHFREEADKLVEDNFKQLREKHQVRLDEEAVTRLVEEIFAAHHDPTMKPEEAERISFFHGKD